MSKRGEVVFTQGIITVEIAQSVNELTRGLGLRASLLPDNGMWFVFPESGRVGIWMKDMQFPIDIIWFDDSFAIVSIAKNVSPETFPEIFYPDQDARYVLEINAGTVDKWGLRVGNRVELR